MLRSPLRAYFVSGFMLSPPYNKPILLRQRFARIDRRRLLRLSRIRFKREADGKTTASSIRCMRTSVGMAGGSLLIRPCETKEASGSLVAVPDDSLPRHTETGFGRAAAIRERIGSFEDRPA